MVYTSSSTSWSFTRVFPSPIMTIVGPSLMLTKKIKKMKQEKGKKKSYPKPPSPHHIHTNHDREAYSSFYIVWDTRSSYLSLPLNFRIERALQLRWSGCCFFHSIYGNPNSWTNHQMDKYFLYKTTMCIMWQLWSLFSPLSSSFPIPRCLAGSPPVGHHACRGCHPDDWISIISLKSIPSWFPYLTHIHMLLIPQNRNICQFSYLWMYITTYCEHLVIGVLCILFTFDVLIAFTLHAFHLTSYLLAPFIWTLFLLATLVMPMVWVVLPKI